MLGDKGSVNVSFITAESDKHGDKGNVNVSFITAESAKHGDKDRENAVLSPQNLLNMVIRGGI